MPRSRTTVGITALREGVVIALDSLRANKTRAALTILGIAIGVMVVMTMAATVKGINTTIDDMLEQMGPTSFFVLRFQGGNDADDDDEDPAWWRNPPLNPTELGMIQRLPSVEIAIMQDNLTRQVIAGATTIQADIQGKSAGWPRVTGGEIVAGRNYTAIEEAAGDKVAVLGTKTAETLFGRSDPLGRPIRIAGQTYLVIGVYEPPPNLFSGLSSPAIVIPFTTYNRYAAQWRGWASFTVRPRDGVPLRDALDDVTTAMRRTRGLRPSQENNFALLTQDVILDAWSGATSMFFLVMIALSGIGLLVGGIGVIAIMMISVTERTREIGVRKALGATRREILWQFLVEASTLTLVGGSVGLVLGGGAVMAVNALTPLPATVPLWSIVAALAASALTGIVFGIVPANKASKLDPVEALRYE